MTDINVAAPVTPAPPAAAAVPAADHSKLKEYVTALLAMMVVVGAFGLAAFAATRVGDKSFTEAKDLLLFINPILGVVIGYYFSKTATENVANRAEAITSSPEDPRRGRGHPIEAAHLRLISTSASRILRSVRISPSMSSTFS